MEKAYHYTSKRCWDEIVSSDQLSPKTKPIDMPGSYSRGAREGVFSLFRHETYLVCLQDPTDRGWVEYGLMQYLLKRSGDDRVLLELPVKGDGAFVREHAHFSPRRMMEKHGVDLFEKDMNGYPTTDEQKLIEKAVRDYLKSSKPLEKYCGDYIAPEIWLPQTTAVMSLRKVDL